MKSAMWRVWLILAVLAWCGYALYPTVRWSQLTPEQAAADPTTTEALRERSINLGLDLQGGIHMVLGIKSDKLKQNLLLAVNRRLPDVFKEKGIAVTGNRIVGDGVEFEVNPEARSTREADIAEALQIVGYLGAPQYIVDPARPDRAVVKANLDREQFDREVREATGRALEIIRNRIDAFGVAEPVIQQSGADKIVVQLPGAADPKRARDLIGRTAQLQFHRVREDAELNALLPALDRAAGGALLAMVSSTDQGSGLWDIHIKAEEKEKFQSLLALDAVRAQMPAGARVFLGAVETQRGERIVRLYLLQDQAAMTGENLEMARISFDERNRPAVSFEFNSAGAEQFGELTAELMRGQKRLAILLDDVVQSAPSVRSQIKSRGEITGSFTQEEARDLAVVLRSGALPAPVEVLEDRTVGPSLGRDSIEKGMTAAAVGTVIVLIFMLFFYRVSGIIADACLLMNVAMMMAVLAAIGGTLTLPGIAGIVLTIGMAVDANILIYERIKEELRAGKGVYSAINSGYERAYTAIIDSNVTTLISAAALYQYGTGPIRGFAVTLSIGILTSMFTAIFISRTIFDRVILAQDQPRLSI